jgi:hypothetical protein
VIKPPAGGQFVAFPFPSIPFEPAFPIEAPPAPPPRREPVPAALVSLAGVLAAGVAGSAGIAGRRRERMLVV